MDIDSFKSQRKLFFVLSRAGKPIYHRFGDDSLVSGYSGIMRALISFFENESDRENSDIEDTLR